MAESAKIALLPMMILDQNGHYQTVYAPQSLASLGVPTPGAPPLVPLNGAPGIPNFLSPSHPISAEQPSLRDVLSPTIVFCRVSQSLYPEFKV